MEGSDKQATEQNNGAAGAGANSEQLNIKVKAQDGTEIFFKIKLQTISLLQEFGVGKDQLSDINDVANETSLFSYMTRKLKGRLKDFRSKEQESTFEIQKDKILSQKQDERIHYLTETNELLRLS